MRVLVTGCNGFVGSVMCARLSELGHTVIAWDNGARGLNDVSLLPHVTYKRLDLLKGDWPTIHRGWLDGIFHFAAGTGSLDRPLDELRVLNLSMTQKLFHWALSLDVRVFVYPTTSLALGVPDSPYVISKEETVAWLGEMATSTPRIEQKLLLCRFFNVAGAYRGFTERRQHEVHILPTLYAAHRDGKVFVINGHDYATVDGTPSRDFIHVLDVVDYLIYLTQRRLAGEQEALQVHNIGTGIPTTTLQMATLARQMLGQIDVQYGPRRPYDTGELRCPDAARVHAWRPLQGIEAIVRDELAALMDAEEESVDGAA